MYDVRCTMYDVLSALCFPLSCVLLCASRRISSMWKFFTPDFSIEKDEANQAKECQGVINVISQCWFAGEKKPAVVDSHRHIDE